MRNGGSIQTETNSISKFHFEIRVNHKDSKDTVHSYFCSELAFAFQPLSLCLLTDLEKGWKNQG